MAYAYDTDYLGKHWLLECYACSAELLEKAEAIEEIMLEAVKISGATLVDARFHQFSPFGVSGFIVIAESHFSIHTWPEKGYAAIDIFTCGASIDVEKASLFLKEKLDCERLETTFVKRGEIAKTKPSLTDIVSDEL